MPPKLSIVIPAYNEAPAIRAGKLAHVIGWLRGQHFESELIVVDDQSTDDTAALAADALAVVTGETITARVISIPHAGKAAAVIAGIRAAAGRFVLFTDMDQATPIEEAPRLLDALEMGYDVAAGSRGITRPGAPAGRYLLSWGQVALKGLLLGLRITDTQCGFKAFRRRAALEVIEHLVVYAPERLGAVRGPSVTSGFDVEFLLVAQRLGMEIKEAPVHWNYQQTRRVSLLQDARRGLRDLFAILAARVGKRYPPRLAPVEIIRLPVAQWQAYKALRLEMLQTDPQAYGTSYSQAAAQPDIFWRNRLADAAASTRGQMPDGGRARSWLLFAREQGRLVGLIGAYAELDGPPDLATIVSMYVSPGARGKGISRRLMRAILETLQQSGFHTIQLGVNINQRPAFNLYQSFGFTQVDSEIHAMGDGQVHEEWRMEKTLSGEPR